MKHELSIAQFYTPQKKKCKANENVLAMQPDLKFFLLHKQTQYRIYVKAKQATVCGLAT